MFCFRNKSFHLNMGEARAALIAAKDIHIRRVTESDDRRITSSTKLSRDEELTRIASRRLVPPWKM